jgi:hypothetical protein
LHADALFALARTTFEKIDPTKPQIADALMSGLAMFSLKDPSLLAFEDRRTDETIKTIYHIENIPSDTHMCRVLDEVEYTALAKTFKTVLAQVHRGKGLEDMVFYDGHYLISNDGTGYFSSEAVHCDSCLTVQHRNNTTEYRHGFLGSALVHPDQKVVLPLCPEPIKNTDGHTKNDCERNAGRRWLSDFRREHPHMKAIVTEDALGSNAPHLRDLVAHDLRFIIGIKPKSHAYLYDILNGTHTTSYEMTDKDGTHHRFVYQNDIALNEGSPDVRVNVLEYWETDKGGKRQHFAWVTDIPMTNGNVHTLMRGGRARWKIENETFNTLKNQGYQFEHNFGHGKRNLSTVFALLMMLAFLIDQVQQKLCPVFRAALATCSSRRSLWEKVRGAVEWRVFHSMQDIFIAIIERRKAPLPT